MARPVRGLPRPRFSEVAIADIVTRYGNYAKRRGWRPSTVKPGDSLVVIVIPLRNGGPGGLLMEAKAADGKTLGANLGGRQ